MSMERIYAALGFFAAAFIATVAAIALSFTNTEMWSIALSVVAVIFAIAGMVFTLGGRKNKTKE